MKMEENESLLVLGQSGKGKTTFLHLIAGLLQADKGDVLIGNTNITELTPKALDRFRGQNIGVIFQKPYFVKALTIKENLLLAQKLGGTKMEPKRIPEILERLNIGDKLHRHPSELSVGEQQRASIARAIINGPLLLLADEPTSALDDDNAAIVADLLESSAMENNSSLIIVTHDNRLKAKFSKSIQL
jgi:putative ABC transport system ATP-binding protein